jgi:hypothetical protein
MRQRFGNPQSFFLVRRRQFQHRAAELGALGFLGNLVGAVKVREDLVNRAARSGRTYDRDSARIRASAPAEPSR